MRLLLLLACALSLAARPVTPEDYYRFEFVGGDVVGSLLCACHACEAGFGDIRDEFPDGGDVCSRFSAHVPDLQLDTLAIEPRDPSIGPAPRR